MPTKNLQSLYKNKSHMKINNGMKFMREQRREAIMTTHPPQGRQKQQQHDDTTNIVWHFINEEISVKMRKWLEVEAMSSHKDEQKFPKLSLQFDLKIHCNRYHKLPKTSKALVPHEVTIRKDKNFTIFIEKKK